MKSVAEFNNKIINGDCRNVLKQLPDECVDLVFTSPPYNAGMEYENWTDDAEYERFIGEVVASLPRVLKPAGRVVWNILGSITSHGRIYSPLLANWNHLNKHLKFRDFVVWNQLNSENDTAWGSWASASAPHFRHQCEIVLIYFKDEWKKGKGISDIDPKNFPNWTRDIWEISTAQRNGHPCPFPEALADRVIQMMSFVGDTILDPFAGSGTTCASAKKLKRNYIGIENNKKYCAIAERRLAQEFIL